MVEQIRSTLLEKHGAVSVPAPSPSVIPFIFDSLNFKKVLVLKGPGFHDILSSFEASLSGVVAFPYIKSFEKGGHVVKSFSQDVFEGYVLYTPGGGGGGATY